MKILVLSSHTKSLFWYRMDMMQAFVKSGYKVFAAGPDEERVWKDKFKEYNIEYFHISVLRTGINPLEDLKTFKSIKTLMQNIEPDKVFVYQAKTIVYGCLAANNCHIGEVYPMVAGLGSIFRSSGLKNMLARPIMYLLYKLAFGFSKKVFFQNEDDKQFLLKRKILSSNKIVLINGTGVNLGRFKPTPLPSQITFLFIGRLLKDKGIKEYLSACEIIKNKYPSVRCLLVGPYDTNPSAIKSKDLKTYTEKNIVEYFGEQFDVRPYIEQCTTFVLPSYHEGTPKTVLEAMAMGRAIITTDAPGCRETVKNGINGLLVKVKDVKDLVDKMEYVILNPEMNIKFGKNSFELAKEKYDVNKINYKIMSTMNLA